MFSSEAICTFHLEAEENNRFPPGITRRIIFSHILAVCVYLLVVLITHESGLFAAKPSTVLAVE